MLTKRLDGTLSDSRLVSHEGSTELPFESITRHVLFPWVMPVVLDGTTVSEIKVQCIQREQFRITEARRMEAAHERRLRRVAEHVEQRVVVERRGVDLLEVAAARGELALLPGIAGGRRRRRKH